MGNALRSVRLVAQGPAACKSPPPDLRPARVDDELFDESTDEAADDSSAEAHANAAESVDTAAVTSAAEHSDPEPSTTAMAAEPVPLHLGAAKEPFRAEAITIGDCMKRLQQHLKEGGERRQVGWGKDSDVPYSCEIPANYGALGSPRSPGIASGPHSGQSSVRDIAVANYHRKVRSHCQRRLSEGSVIIAMADSVSSMSLGEPSGSDPRLVQLRTRSMSNASTELAPTPEAGAETGVKHRRRRKRRKSTGQVQLIRPRRRLHRTAKGGDLIISRRVHPET
mmetsp:Transcript_9392/g.27564  ORF Transcript_9392/g.27564 Transcript_9392/m.27564 type:complete len:281 (-) Transcript_9392:298-1140(-)